MDSLITAAARALAAGDPLGALKRVALSGRRAPRRYPRADGGGRRRILVLNTPAARLIARGEERLLALDEAAISSSAEEQRAGR
jgi:hypothetical protein